MRGRLHLDLVFGGLIIIIVHVVVQVFVNSIVTVPYMDEPFHINQTQVYCGGNFTSWNPKITTPPGLYVLTISLIVPALLFLGGESVCTLTVVRHLNAVWLLCLYGIVYCLVRRNNRESIGCFVAFLTCLFPLIFFVSFLFYTDLTSTLLVFLMYYYCLRKAYFASATVGMLAVLTRQTNIFWLFFCAGLVACDSLVSWLKKHTRAHKFHEDRILAALQLLGPAVVKETPLVNVMELFSGLFAVLWPYLAVLLLFIIAVVYNGSIALGDKQAHETCFHVVQFYYFHAFTLAFGWPVLLTGERVKQFLLMCWRRRFLIGGMFLAVILCIRFFSFDHPYLLSDNRHYTFYLWRKWFLRHWICPYLLAPVYIFSLFATHDSLRHQSETWRLGYLVCTFLSTVFHRLLEFRYFIIPYVMWRIHAIENRRLNYFRLLLEFGTYVFLNADTIYVFLYMPFKWSNAPLELQRFMW